MFTPHWTKRLSFSLRLLSAVTLALSPVCAQLANAEPLHNRAVPCQIGNDAAIEADHAVPTGPHPSQDGQFGISADANAYTVDTGAGLAFKIRTRGANGGDRGKGDIVSLLWHGVQYQDPRKGSQVNSGFSGLYDGDDRVNVDAARVGNDAIKVTVSSGALTHVYMARRGHPNIYMATYFTAEPKPNLVRFVVRVPHARLPDGPQCADITTAVRGVEAHDVFGLANGETRSKHYSNMRLKDWQYFGATGPGVGMWMVRDNNEGGSGGPFYRSLLDQGTEDQELTYIVNYGENQTEPYRMGVLNSYVLAFTDGEPPRDVSTHWFKDMDLPGYVPENQRGSLEGHFTGLTEGAPYTLALSNAHAQYWGDVSAKDGHFHLQGMLPGQYQATLYRNELQVKRFNVDIQPARTTPCACGGIDHDPQHDAVLWRIGTWDGSPREFRNGNQVTVMHPSDVRMQPWGVPPYIVGRSTPASDFPAYQWKAINGMLVVRFRLEPRDMADHRLRIGITTAFAHARPSITVNQWSAPAPQPAAEPTTRSLTAGSYRGNNATFAFDIPASAFVVGENELKINVTSGNAGEGFLSPGYAFDAIDLLK
ncbi:polysaccharide lyase family protein [Ralstonia sp. CHL-2022]|uniref:rhamnogalacturonan endolyase n=1 Tax=Ralstonia mojiangensis TaxID=2953895 RepID=A0AAE3I8N2_9RALS|nr:rhamnogalacturonan lyase B N-terminal domain-containing protein [Ralstonia mojiangensis]MCT7318578.1 polysaccharide lyase family protein [Ralstonia mojiangensis]